MAMMISATLLLFLSISSSRCTEQDRSHHFDELYGQGVKAYYGNEWKQTVDYMQHSVSGHREVRDARELCFEECKNLNTGALPDYVEDRNTLEFFHRLNQQAVCIDKCKEGQLGDSGLLHATNYEMEQSLERGDVHNYIQMSLYEVCISSKAIILAMLSLAKDSCSIIIIHNLYNVCMCVLNASCDSKLVN